MALLVARVAANDVDDATAKLMAQLATIQQKATGNKSFVNYKSFFQWFLGIALLLLLVEFLIPERKKIPA